MCGQVDDERWGYAVKRQKILKVVYLPLEANYGVGAYSGAGQSSGGRVAGQHENIISELADDRNCVIE